MPVSQAMIVATYPPEKRAFAQAVFGMAVVIGPAIAPAIGGYVAEEYNWRWVFLLVLPLCFISFIAVFAFIRDLPRGPSMQFDWTGFTAISLLIIAAQLIMDRGQRLDWFESYEILAYVALMALSGWVFVIHTATYPHPFIKPQLFKDRNFVLEK